jgi:hypothetical protein
VVADFSHRPDHGEWSAFGFGLRLVGNLVIPSLQPVDRESPSRTVITRSVARRELDSAWRCRQSTRLVERRLVDGRVGMSVDRSEDGSFRIWAPRHGAYHVCPDGLTVVGSPPGGPAWRWERLVLAQVLPLTAALQGLEVLHASAVAVNGQVIAFTGGSGAGKTSTAFHAVRNGGKLVTDDVLAVELRDGVPFAFPGSTVARVDPMQLRGLARQERRALGPVVARAEKHHLALAAANRSLPLGAIYHIVRPVQGAQTLLVTESDPLALLGSAFLPYLQDAGRLTNQFAVCAAIIERVPLRRVQVPDRVSAAAVAAAVLKDAAGA